MTNDTDNTIKVFICYARESPDALEHFVEKFKDYNPDFELLFDKKPHSGNMHERFKGFARKCDIALILVNARLIRPESYANTHEILILKERLKRQEVIVMGVLLQDVNPEPWNKDGDVYFVPLTNNDLPTARRVDEYRDKYNREPAVYKNIPDTARDTYHKELREFLLALLEEHKGKLKPMLALEPGELLSKDETVPKDPAWELRSATQTDLILSRMTTDTLLHKLEEKLSYDKSFWNAIDKRPNDETQSYTWWYLHWHHKAYRSDAKLIRDLEDYEFERQRGDIEANLQMLNDRLINLFSGTDGGNCFSHLLRLKDNIDTANQTLIRGNYEYGMQTYREMLIETAEDLAKELMRLSGKAKELTSKA